MRLLQKFYTHISRLIKSVFGRILISHIALVIITGVLVSLLSFYVSERTLIKQLVYIDTAAINQVEDSVSNLVDMVYQLAYLYLLDSEIEDAVKAEYHDKVEQVFREREIEEKISVYSLSFDQLRTHTMVLGYNGSRFTARHDSSDQTINNIMKMSWYSNLLKNKNQFFWFEDNPGFNNIPTGTSAITFVKIMQNQYDFKRYGVLFISLEEPMLFDLYKGITDSGRQMYIMNSEGKIISDSKRDLTGGTLSPSEMTVLMGSLKSDSGIGIYETQNYITMIKKVYNLDWYIVYSIPKITNFRIINSLKVEIALIALICIFFSFLLALFIARFFSIPLLRLTKKVSGYLTSFNSTEKARPNIYEVDLLSSEYEELINRLDDTIRQLVAEQEEKRKAEFHALQLQIKPHFLYNTLNSIKCLVWTHRFELIEPMLNALIKLLQQTVSLNSEVIKIEEELENTRNYVFIQQIRISKVIELKCYISQGLENCEIPKLILQPIAENAIFHGIEPKNGNGCISIYCTSTNNKVIIEVQDNGIGMDNETSSKLLSDEYIPDKGSFSGIGVKNVDRRLKLLFGEEYGLIIKSEPRIGTLVTITLPEIH